MRSSVNTQLQKFSCGFKVMGVRFTRFRPRPNSTLTGNTTCTAGDASLLVELHKNHIPHNPMVAFVTFSLCCLYCYKFKT